MVSKAAAALAGESPQAPSAYSMRFRQLEEERARRLAAKEKAVKHEEGKRVRHLRYASARRQRYDVCVSLLPSRRCLLYYTVSSALAFLSLTFIVTSSNFSISFPAPSSSLCFARTHLLHLPDLPFSTFLLEQNFSRGHIYRDILEQQERLAREEEERRQAILQKRREAKAAETQKVREAQKAAKTRRSRTSSTRSQSGASSLQSTQRGPAPVQRPFAVQPQTQTQTQTRPESPPAAPPRVRHGSIQEVATTAERRERILTEALRAVRGDASDNEEETYDDDVEPNTRAKAPPSSYTEARGQTAAHAAWAQDRDTSAAHMPVKMAATSRTSPAHEDGAVSDDSLEPADLGSSDSEAEDGNGSSMELARALVFRRRHSSHRRRSSLISTTDSHNLASTPKTGRMMATGAVPLRPIRAEWEKGGEQGEQSERGERGERGERQEKGQPPHDFRHPEVPLGARPSTGQARPQSGRSQLPPHTRPARTPSAPLRRAAHALDADDSVDVTLSPSPPLSSAHMSEEDISAPATPRDQAARHAPRNNLRGPAQSGLPRPKATAAAAPSDRRKAELSSDQGQELRRAPAEEPTDENIEAMWTLLRARRPSSGLSSLALGLDHLRRDTQRRPRPGMRHMGRGEGPGAAAWAQSRQRSMTGGGSREPPHHRSGWPVSSAAADSAPAMKLSLLEEELKRQVAQLDDRVRQIDARMAERGEGHVLPPDPHELLAERARLQEELEQNNKPRRRAGSARVPPRPPQHGRPPRGGSGRSAPAATQRRRASGFTSGASRPPPTKAEVDGMEDAMQAMMAANARPVKPRPSPRRPVGTNSYLDRFASSTDSR